MKRTIRVVLQKSIPTLGEPGDVKDVAFGYAKNMLFPNNLAAPATERALHGAAALKGRAAAQAAKNAQAQAALRARLAATTLRLEEPANETGALYGAVRHEHIERALAAQGVRIDASLIDMPQRIDAVGSHAVLIRVGNEHLSVPLEVVAAPTKETGA